MTGAQAITALYLFASIAALVASFNWFRFVKVHAAQAGKGYAPTLRHLSEAATTTACALFLAAIGFLASIM